MKKKRISMMVAASKALDYKKNIPNAEIGEIMNSIMKDSEIIESANISAVPVVTRVVKYKENNPGLSDREILQRIMNEIPEIMSITEKE